MSSRDKGICGVFAGMCVGVFVWYLRVFGGICTLAAPDVTLTLKLKCGHFYKTWHEYGPETALPAPP